MNIEAATVSEQVIELVELETDRQLAEETKSPTNEQLLVIGKILVPLNIDRGDLAHLLKMPERVGWTTISRQLKNPDRNCAGADTETFFVSGAAQNRVARACQGCPAKTECLADALLRESEYGIYGGTTERQRRALVKLNKTKPGLVEVLTEYSRIEQQLQSREVV